MAYRALEKLEKALRSDPLIREWLAEQGYISRDEV